jgi:phosphohistidine phosphatase SixA
VIVLALALAMSGLASPAATQPLEGPALVNALRGGGYVLLMRHAASPGAPPTAAAANKDNVKLERQLDETGRASAKAMGEAFIRLRIPVGQVLSSPTYRALETARFADWRGVVTFPELGDRGQSMQAGAVNSAAEWLHRKVGESPAPGRNTVIITHVPNIRSVFEAEAAALADGETLVLRPDGKGGATLVARVKIEEWPRLANSAATPPGTAAR